MENRILLRPSAEKSSTPILDGVENSSSDIQKCGFCLNLSAKQDFPPRYMDAYCGVENRVLLRPSTKNIVHPDDGWGGRNYAYFILAEGRSASVY